MRAGAIGGADQGLTRDVDKVIAPSTSRRGKAKLFCQRDDGSTHLDRHAAVEHRLAEIRETQSGAQ